MFLAVCEELLVDVVDGAEEDVAKGCAVVLCGHLQRGRAGGHCEGERVSESE